MVKRILSLLLTCGTVLLLAAPASAHTHPGDPAPVYKTSSWAQEEVVQAGQLDLIPRAFEDYTAPITRLEFAEFALQYLAKSEFSSPDAYIGMALQAYAETGQDSGRSLFPDVDTTQQSPEARTVLAAYALGLVKGRDDGTFAPDAPITRQEAAALLLNAYKALGGSAASEDGLSRFSDADAIPDYARDGANSMAVLSVMNGTGDGAFSPAGSYTVEQCVLSFLHLWADAPICFSKINVTPKFTYEQASAYVKSLVRTDDAADGYEETGRWSGSEADIVRLDWSGSTDAHSVFYLIRRKGSVQELDLGICYDGTRIPISCTIEDGRFSAEDSIFRCYIRVPETLYSGGTVLHAAGKYELTLYISLGISEQRTYSNSVFYIEEFFELGVPDRSYRQTARLDGETGTLIRKDRVASQGDDALLILIRKDGTFLQLDMGLANAEGVFQTNWATEDLAFSADGQAITGTVSVPEDVLQDGEVLLKAGAYPFSIDVATGVVSLLS